MSTPLNGSILKAFSILRLISHERPEISASIVAAELGINNATAHRFLLTLEETGALVSYRRGHFCLGPMTQELGQIAEATNQIAAHIRPIIRALARDLNESVMVCRLGRLGPTCIAVAQAERPITVNISVGTVLPMVSSAQGKLWLASMDPQDRSSWLKSSAPNAPIDLEQILAEGFARNLGDNEPDIGALAVPIWGDKGNVALTLSTFGMLSRFDDAMLERALPGLIATAKQIRA